MTYELLLEAGLALIGVVCVVVNLIVYWKINKVLKEHIDKLPDEKEGYEK